MAKTPEERIAALEREVEALLGIIAAQSVAITSLIAKHPDHEQLIMHLASVTEMADAGPGWNALTPKQREMARLLMENFQGIKPCGPIQPITSDPAE